MMITLLINDFGGTVQVEKYERFVYTYGCSILHILLVRDHFGSSLTVLQDFLLQTVVTTFDLSPPLIDGPSLP
jgi:hypothetical protein